MVYLSKFKLEIEDKINSSLDIDESITYKNNTLFSSTWRYNVFYGFLSSAKSMGRNISKVKT